MYTTNNWTSRSYVELTNVTTNAVASLPIGSTVNFNSLIKWVVSSAANTDTATVSGTTSGVLNYDAMFIKRYEGRNHWVSKTLLKNPSFEIEARTNAPGPAGADGARGAKRRSGPGNPKGGALQT